MRRALKKYFKEEDKEEDSTSVFTESTELLRANCDCGNELVINGNKPGWQINFHHGVDFTCPCGKILTVSVTE